MNKVYLDGQFLPENEAFIPVSDRGLLMGDGVFVTIQVKNGSAHFLKRHLHKLEEQAKKLFLCPPSIEEATVDRLIEANHAYNGVWRLKIYYTGGLDTAMRLPNGRKGSLLMILKPYIVPPYAPLKMGLFQEPISTLTSGLKSLSHIVRYMIMEKALQEGFDDYITKTAEDVLLESAFGNIFWIKDDHFYTPDPILPLHQGITIAVVSEIVKELGCKHHFVKMTLADVPKNAFLFRCNTMGGIRPITSLEGITFNRNQTIEKMLLSEYETWIQKASGAITAPH